MLVLIFLLCGIPFAKSGDGKRLVIFAGPHHSGHISSVEQFFYHYADVHKKKHKQTFGMRKWRYPHFNSSLVEEVSPNHPPYSVLDHLVTHNTNEDIQNELIQILQQTWSETQEGMIIGTAEFDQAAGGYKDGLQAMKRVVSSLEGLQPDHVTVVLNYRTPRIDQWVSTWWQQHQQKLTEGTDEDFTYEDYMCSKEYEYYSEQLMATSMNPLGIAQSCIEEGYQVSLLDMAGIEQAQRDLPTVIACDIVKAVCDTDANGNEYLRNHDEHPFHENETLQVEEALPDASEAELAEELLLWRDCTYESALRDKIQVIHNASVWKICSSVINFPPGIDDSSTVYGALANQVTCTGKDKKHKRQQYGDVSIEKILNGQITIAEEKETLKRAGHDGGFLEAVLFPVILIAVGGYQIYQMQMARTNNNNNPNRCPNTSSYDKAAATTTSSGEAELSEMNSAAAATSDDDDDFQDEP